MEIHFYQINYLAVFVAMIVHQIIGSLWYSSFLFGNLWVKEAKIDLSQVNKSEAMKGFLYSAILSVIVYFLIAILIDVSGAYSPGKGIFIGLIAGVIVALMTATNYIYESRSFKLFLITSLYPLISFATGGGILGGWH